MEGMSMSMESLAARKMPLWRKIGYGIGDLGSNFCWTFVASFVLIYFTNTLGISAAIVGSIIMFSRILDGVTDLFMGQIIDRTKSKMGKARFWYFLSSFPVAIMTYLIFNVPNFNSTGKYIYIAIMYTVMGAVFYTMNNIAYSSLIALSTKNSKDRVGMTSARYLFAILAVLIISSFTMKFVEAFGGGQAGWRATSLLYSVICLVTLLIPVFTIKELPIEEFNEGIGNKDQTKEKIGVGKSFVLLLKNRYFLIILGLYLTLYLGTGISQGIGVYFATYNLGDAGLLGPLSMAAMLPMLLLMPFMPKLTDKLGMRNACIAGSIVSLVGAIIVVFGNNIFVMLMVGLIIRGMGMVPMMASLNALIAATDDYSYLRFNHRMTSTMYSCASVGIKVGTGLGTALVGLLLEFGGFLGTATSQTPTALLTIKSLYIVPGLIQAVLALILLYMLKVEKRNEVLRAELAPAA